MTSVFVDTSGLYAAIDSSDRHHAAAAASFSDLLDGLADEALVARTHSGVLIECASLVQARLGLDAARYLHDDVVPLLDVIWIDDELYRRGTTALLAAGRRDVSLVDWISFEVIREHVIDCAFALDVHFAERGIPTFSS